MNPTTYCKIKLRNSFFMWLYLIILAIMFPLNLRAKHLTQDEALARLNTMTSVRAGIIPSESPKIKEKALQTNSFYVFRDLDTKEYIITPADDRLSAVLAKYTADNNTSIPPSMAQLLNQYTEAINNLSEHTYVKRIDVARNVIEPIVKTQWAQGLPYNIECPWVSGSRAITGCVATAMAQLLNCKHFIDGTSKAIPGYTTSSHQIDLPELPVRTFNWNNMDDSEIAHLMLYCGQSVNMDYDTDASGASTAMVPIALKMYWGADQNIAMFGRGKYNDIQWEDLIYNELSNGIPVLYDAYSIKQGGHAFLVDGYKEGLYHINWGWGGLYDGYFSLGNLDPGDTNSPFYSQAAMIGFSSAPSQTDDGISKAVIENAQFDENIWMGIDVKSCASLRSNILEPYELQFAWAICNPTGEIVEFIGETNAVMYPSESKEIEFSINILGPIQDGEYNLMLFNRSHNTHKWIQCINPDNITFKCTVNGAYVYVEKVVNTYDVEQQQTIDGITYNLVTIKDTYRDLYFAYILPLMGELKYSGDIIIPSTVEYMGHKYIVQGGGHDHFSTDGSVFCDSPELTSMTINVSTGEWTWNLDNDENLKTLVFGEGLNQIHSLGNLPSLERVDCPSTLTRFEFPKNCKATEFHFADNNGLSFFSFPFEIEKVDIFFSSDWPASDYYQTEAKIPVDQQSVDVDPNWTIHVPQGTAEIYASTFWSKCNIVENSTPLTYQTLWDYGRGEGNGGGFAFGRGSYGEMAMKIPASALKAYIGARISAVDFTTNQIHWGEIGEQDYEYVFVSAPGVQYLSKQDITIARGVQMKIKLDNPVTITGTDLYIGVGKKGAIGASVASADLPNLAENTWLVRGEMMPIEWEDFSGNGRWNIGAWIEMGDYPVDVAQHSLSITKSEPQRNTESSKQKKITGMISPGTQKVKTFVVNRSPFTIHNLTFDIKSGEYDISKKIVNLPMPLPPNRSHYVDFEFNVPRLDLPGRHHNLDISIAEVDGLDDEIKENSTFTQPFVPHNDLYKRVMIAECTTGTWCPLSPRAYAMTSYMLKKYPDSFIPIFVHDDEMAPLTDEYKKLNELADWGSPLMWNNRNDWGFDERGYEITPELEIAEGKISLSAYFDVSKIIVDAVSEFAFNDINGDYRLAFALLENGVGPYDQANNYAYFPDTPSTNDEDPMDIWFHSPNPRPMIFDNVAREIYGGFYGEEGVFPTSISKGELYHTYHEFNLPYNIDEDADLSLVGMLIDGDNGQIINAAKCTITGHYTVPVNTINEPIFTEEDIYNGPVYDPLGIKVADNYSEIGSLPPGVYICAGRKIFKH